MINRRLIAMSGGAKRYIFLTVLLQWIGLLANAAVVFAVAWFIGRVFDGAADFAGLLTALIIAGTSALIRIFSGYLSAKTSFGASAGVKKLLREQIYGKLLRLGGPYTETLSTAEVLQTATEGVDQLETYFGKYLPQFFYSMLAPLTLFVIIAPLSLPASAVLLICTPLIPALIMLIMKMAKKMLKRQWKSYVTLGGVFLENIQGMTALKVFSADGARQEAMRVEAERFRRSTMRVLMMQLNSIAVMDVIAFGGAAFGVIMAVRGFAGVSVSLPQSLVIALLSAEFFIPLRQLGSYFHVAMNGMAACERMFQILDMPEPPDGNGTLPRGSLTVNLERLGFSYDGGRKILDGVTLTLKPGGMVSLAGESGSGKSTIAALISGRRTKYSGSIIIGGAELRDLSRESLRERVALVTHDGYVFAGTVSENLRMAKPNASDSELTAALDTVKLLEFFNTQNGLNTIISERGANLSGGQRQRLCIARALLRGCDFYIFDEATSNIDAESEATVMDAVHELAETKTVLLITHRLANAVSSANICLLENGGISESGTHAELLAKNGAYARLYNEQKELENYAGGNAL
ncbi:MAG: ABC transporter ATP-binding protein/permease [Oscillospiraceae bacterium]|nr:ABC transporter ATP-binding protein/permease [Oscillospiraceae bacterium]